ncbi:glycosyltransferase family 4 protein, partial [Chlamydiales bacterium]|nr:glycosyltransferase family 4 protein [Chlamydiales bacterium]
MRIIHLEASTGWGGQEIRILREAITFREKGYELYFATKKGATLAKKAREAGFETYEYPFKLPFILFQLIFLFFRLKIDLVITHSSWDAWMGGIAARLSKKRVIRTRHLSTPIREGLNSRVLYNTLADNVVTTCVRVADKVREQANQPNSLSIPTGVLPSSIQLKNPYPFPEGKFLVGTACVFRSWKGLLPLLKAVELLNDPDILCVFIGDGPMRSRLESSPYAYFTGYLENPYDAIHALDVFALLSTAHEGVSQALLQAAYLKRPLITTNTGGLDEVCLHQKTGLVVPIDDPQKTAEAILKLKKDFTLRQSMGHSAKEHVLKH